MRDARAGASKASCIPGGWPSVDARDAGIVAVVADVKGCDRYQCRRCRAPVELRCFTAAPVELRCFTAAPVELRCFTWRAAPVELRCFTWRAAPVAFGVAPCGDAALVAAIQVGTLIDFAPVAKPVVAGNVTGWRNKFERSNARPMRGNSAACPAVFASCYPSLAVLAESIHASSVPLQRYNSQDLLGWVLQVQVKRRQ